MKGVNAVSFKGALVMGRSGIVTNGWEWGRVTEGGRNMSARYCEVLIELKGNPS